MKFKIKNLQIKAQVSKHVAVVLLLSSMIFTACDFASAEYETDSQGLRYTLINKGAEYCVSKDRSDITGEIIIPEIFDSVEF